MVLIVGWAFSGIDPDQSEYRRQLQTRQSFRFLNDVLELSDADWKQRRTLQLLGSPGVGRIHILEGETGG
jgi:hypothetical protein